MAAVAGPLDRRLSSAVSVDIDPGWYEGQLETADAADATALTPDTGAAAAAPPPLGAAAEQSAGEAKPPGSHVPTVMTKLQKWGDYESFGEPVWPTNFIPMKTPLSHEILDNWQLPEAPKHRLTVSTLLEAEKAAGRRVGLLLDLSNHDCLYDVDIPPDVQYLHVQLVAKELPPLEFVREVARAASGFWAQHPDQYIAVHCAYGFNRTGFVVCSYLIECCGLTVDQALQSFAASRPPGVKHERFRQELWARYGNSNSSNSSSSSIPPPAPQPKLLPENGSSSASSSSTGFYLAARTAAAAAGVCEGSSCRPCDSTASSSGTDWPGSTNALAAAAGGVEQQGLACSSATSLTATAAAAAAAAAAAVSPAGLLSSAADGAPAVGVCDLGDTQQPAAAAGGSGRRRNSLLGYSSSSSSTDDVRCSTGGCLPRVSSAGTAPQTPSAPPLPPPVLTPSSSRALLTGSPALRLSNRCWSSNSVGDNSSIGCSPSSSAADLVTLRTSGLNSAHSSGLDSSAGGAPDTPYCTAAAGSGAAGHLEGRESLSQQWGLGGGGDGCLGHTSSSSSHHHQQQQQLRGSGGGGDGGVLLADDGEEEEEQDDVCEVLDEGCFEMDPCTDALPPQQRQQQQQSYHCQQQQQQLSSSRSVARRKSVTFDDTTLCCEQPAPGCRAVQQLPTADLNMLLASVSIDQQQQQQLLPSLTQLRPPPLQQQQQQAVAADDCSCSCHSLERLSVSPDAAVGSSICGSSSSSNHPPQAQLVREPGSGGRMGRGYYSSEDGVMDPLENESFGKLTSADLLKNLRSLQQKYDKN